MVGQNTLGGQGSTTAWIVAGWCNREHHRHATLGAITLLNINLPSETCLRPSPNHQTLAADFPIAPMPYSKILTYVPAFFWSFLSALGRLTCFHSPRTFTLITAMSLGGGYLMIQVKISSRKAAGQGRWRLQCDSGQIRYVLPRCHWSTVIVRCGYGMLLQQC